MKHTYLLPALAAVLTAHAAELDPQHAKLVPADKGLTPKAREALLARDDAPVWRGEQLRYTGMPVSGIGTGQMYLSGDGRLWYWGIFNQGDPWSKNDGYRYAFPSDPTDFIPLDQGFEVLWKQDGKTQRTPLNSDGFKDIAFHPNFPLGIVDMNDPRVPFAVKLTGYTPYIPLDLDRSTYPVTILEYDLRNTGSEPLELEINGWVDNHSAEFVKHLVSGTRRNERIDGKGFSAIVASATIDAVNIPAQQESVLFENFNGEDFGEWTVTGNAFGDKPDTYTGKEGKLQGKLEGKAAISVRPDAKQTGTLLSQPFTIEHNFINLTFAAGRNPAGAGIRLLIDDKEVRTVSGIKPRKMQQHAWNVGDFIGRSAQIEIFDTSTDLNGYVIVDHIKFSNLPIKAQIPKDPTRPPDLGELALTVVGNNLPVLHAETVEKPIAEKMTATIGTKLILKPNEEKTVTFILSWRYPIRGNLERTYAKRWPDIQSQVAEVVKELPRLRKQTELFAETWRDSTLPHWLLNRILIPVAALNTGTVLDMAARNRFVQLEGSDSIGGNCTHVYHYAQGTARLFPEIERISRLNVELGIGFTKDGQIKYRGVPGNRFMTAMDGTSGTILRVLREHQMSADDEFLKKAWPKTKRAMNYLIKTYDSDQNGITQGFQHHTLDAKWAGDIPWLSSMYMAALHACEEMATIMGDTEFAAKCAAIVNKGETEFVERMWNEELGYFVMKADPKIKRPSLGTYEGVHIDQVLGEWWLTQVGLDPLLPEDKTRSALAALYRYNYLPDVGPYREAFISGRWYAVAGDPGLLMTTFPYGGRELVTGKKAQGTGYLNECMTGFEWQAAAHMIHAGLIGEGLQVVKALDERYAPEKRNPFNEIECGDHYARAMASYSVLINLSGYRYDGPAGKLAFAPKVTPHNFRAPFTVAEGWGTFAQQRTDKTQTVSFELRHGKLNLSTLETDLPEGITAKETDVTINGNEVTATNEQQGSTLIIRFEHPVVIQAGQQLEAKITTR